MNQNVAAQQSVPPPEIIQELAHYRALAHQNFDPTLGKYPAELKLLPNYVVWAFALRQNRNSQWAVTKIPYQPLPNGVRREARSNEPCTWRTLAEAQHSLAEGKGFFDGIGFMFQGSGYSGIDLDNVLVEGGHVVSWADQLLAELRSGYIEISVRGRGLHTIVRGTFTGGGKSQKFDKGTEFETGFELYCAGRFFAVSGKPYNNAPSVIADYDAQGLHDRFLRGEIGSQEFQAQQAAQARARAAGPKRVVNVANFINRHGIEINGQPNLEVSFTRYSIACPGCGAKNAYLLQHSDGGVSMACYHDSCPFSNKRGDHWEEFARQYESSKQADARSFKYRTPINRDAPVAPLLRREALYGLPGDVVKIILPCSETNDVTLLLHLLIGFGNLIGRSAYYLVENTRHYCNLFYCAVGDTSRGRKGTAWGQIRPLLAAVDSTWAQSRIQSGLSSGEGLIAAVGDQEDKNTDKRLLLVQTEFAGVLRVMNREGSTLSTVIRDAWDDGSLHTLTKRDPLHVEGAHIGIIGHITKDELRRCLSETESANGFANRFLWARSQRSKFLPESAEIDKKAINDLVEKLKSAVHAGRATEQMHRDTKAREWWATEYRRLSEGVPGLLGAITSRAEAQVLRLSMVYALFDCTDVIRVEHLEAAKAVWDYCFDSAKFIFGSALGYPLADEIWNALRTAGDAGLGRTQISSEVLGRNYKASQIDAALTFLEERALAHRTNVGEGRNTTEVWYAGPRIENGPVTVH